MIKSLQFPSINKMGLLPLEFSDCLLDSPYFRENLRAHEKQLDAASEDIKTIARCIREVTEAARSLSAAKRALADALEAFRFDSCGAGDGSPLTDDEVIVANSLKEFANFFNQVEDEMDQVLSGAEERFQSPLESFRKQHLEAVRKTRKELEKRTARACAAQDRHANTSARREEALAEAAEAARSERRQLEATSLRYVYLIHVARERKKVEFVEAILGFMQSWASFYRHGHSVTADFSPYFSDVHRRVQTSRDNFASTVEHFADLRDRMLERRDAVGADPGALNKMYARQGYLYRRRGGKLQLQLQLLPAQMPDVMQQWQKCYAQYRAQGRQLAIIDYSQQNSGGRITSTEAVRVTECACKDAAVEATGDKFRFIVTGEDLETGAMVTHTFQAMSDYERKQWVEAMGGKWPSVSTLQRIKADSVEDNLNSNAFIFLKDCLAELEARGLRDHGLYRVGGVVSKVKRLLNVGLVERGAERLDLSDPKQWESKTIASAVKQYFRDLSKPLMTHQLYPAFLEAAKGPDKDEAVKIQEVAAVARRLPRANREMLTVLMRHLKRVAANSHVNLMTAANLGVCFGPTLLRPKEETVATIMDIKFCNEVVEILIEQCNMIFPVGGDSSPEVGKNCERRNDNVPSSANSTASMTTGGEDTPDRAVRGGSTPQRTSSVGSFSQLSTNSLPDFKDFRTTVKIPVASHSPITDNSRIRSRSCQQEQAKPEVVLPRKQVSLPSRNPQHVEVHLRKFEESHQHHNQQSSLRSMKSSQDDLMASLEMMNLLAADLPSKVSYSSRGSPLKRSQTLQPNSSSPKSSRKPPLPKLSSTNNTPITSSHPYSTLFSNRSNTSPSPSLSSNSNSCDSGNSAAASPRMSNSTRAPQSEFLSRMQEKLNNRSRSNSLDNNNTSNLSSQTPPALPVRKYRQVIVSPSTVVRSENKKLSSNGDLHSPTSLEDHAKREENSPPTDSGVAESPVINKSDRVLITDDVLDDCSTISSSVVSVDSVGKTKSDNDNLNKADCRLSRYDNVVSNTRGEDGDDEASEDGSSVVQQVEDDDDVTISRLSSQEREFEECEQPDILHNKIGSFPVVNEEEEEEEDSNMGAAFGSSSHLKKQIGAANNRASGMYDNVEEEEEEDEGVGETEKVDEARKEFGENEKRGMSLRPHPSLSITQEGDELGRQKEAEGEGEDGFIETLEGAEGINSIRRMLAVGQTSDV